MIRHILFDLDSTLYSVRFGLEIGARQRIQDFAVPWLAIPFEEALQKWKDGFQRYGTTIEWLTSEMGFTAVDDYHAYTHPESEVEPLLPDPQLRSFLENLPCPYSILTNSPDFHAERVINKLGLDGLFHRIFDIKFNNHKGKPNPLAYRRPLEALGLRPEEVLFVDDLPRYVEGYLAIGGKGVLLDEMDAHKEYPNERVNSLYELARFFN